MESSPERQTAIEVTVDASIEDDLCHGVNDVELQVGDECEAELGGAFSLAKVSQVVGDKYCVQFFDGDRADLEREQIKMLKPPSPVKDEIDTTGLTKKEIKRLQKKTEKKARK